MTLPSSPTDPQARSRCAALAARLAAQRPVAAWSLLLSAACLLALAAVAAGWAMPASRLCLAAWSLGAMLGLAERYLALRLHLDEGLFAALACGALPDLAALDDALAWLGLRPASSSALRPLDERLRGTQALMRRHLGVVLLQTLCVLSALIAGLHAGLPSP
ncbi:hypothetical protein [Pseudacidovorax intermedius]|uniref:hypothetical protein n=1 Tax=Pseudacidovorax intermedius TaxID=433924 RepID=UPI0026F0BFB5|nr:hypothetical protein [Pseudacidovorax intermedius]